MIGSNKKLLQAAAGSAGGDPLYAEDVFSTYLYDGNGSAQTITNGIDLAGEGGLVWIKDRAAVQEHVLTNTISYPLMMRSNSTAAEFGASSWVNAFSSTGFTIGSASYINTNAANYASWTFRKAEKFFDVVTWTGNSTAGRTVAHNLGSAPKFVIVKRTDTANNWICWHSGIAITKYLQLNSTSPAYNDGGIFWDSTLPDASNITLGSDSGVNATGSTYVAYLFASDAGGFGDDGSENIIKCGSVTTGAGAIADVSLGWEPQWVLVKTVSEGGVWYLVDSMRGFVTYGTSGSKTFFANSTNPESDIANFGPTADGFKFEYGSGSGTDLIYIAIRRPMKTPESGTEVFGAVAGAVGDPNFLASFPVDMGLWRTTGGDNWKLSSRLTGVGELNTNATTAEITNSFAEFDYMNGWYSGNEYSPYMSWMFKRATGFMDVVAYSGDGTAKRQITHNLGSAPGMIIVKCRTASNTYWETWQSSLPNDNAYGSNVALNSAEGYGGFARFSVAADQTAAYWTTGSNGEPNTSGQTYISYLFATLDGVSKVGSYTGTGSNVNVDCGFSAGARFILIKRSDSTGDWYVWDSVRGIVAGNDPYLLLNSTAAEVTNTDYIDPLSSGFTVTSSAPAALNASGGTYIFLAIA